MEGTTQWITTVYFSKAAIEYAKKYLGVKVILVDGIKLTELMLDYNHSVSIVNLHEI